MKPYRPHSGVASLVLSMVFAGALASANPLGLVSVRSPSLAPAYGGNGDSGPAVISQDGRYVLFTSTANNLTLCGNGNPVPVLIPASLNVYLRDRSNQVTSLVSVNQAGNGGGDGHSIAAGISSNGQFALFQSSADNLMSGDTNNTADVFLRDMLGGTNILVSVSTNGGVGNGNSGSPVMTPDGRYVAFVSSASNLVANDLNGIPDVFVRDTLLGTTTLASPGATSAGATAGSASFAPVITPNGRYVLFLSSAINLVAGVTTTNDLYVRDLVLQTTHWASATARSQLHQVFGSSNAVCFSPNISADGSLVAYETAVPGSTNGIVLRYNLSTGQTDVVCTNANAPLSGAYEDICTLSLSPDGNFVAYLANPTNASTSAAAIYLWNAATGTNQLVSAALGGAVPASGNSWFPLIDGSDRYVAFFSNSTNLTANPLLGEAHLYCYDTQAGTMTLVDSDTDGVGMGVNPAAFARFNDNTGYLLFESINTADRNLFLNTWLYSLQSNTTELVSVQSPSIQSQTPDGPSALSTGPLSANAQFICFTSDADNLVTNDLNDLRDVFVRDLASGTTILVSVATNGWSGAGFSSEASISATGRYVVFSSAAPDLVPGDTNNAADVFERDLQACATTLVSVDQSGTGPGNAASYSPVMSSDARFVLFRSQAQNLAAGSFGSGVENLFLRDLQLGVTYALTASSSSPAVNSSAMTPDGHFVAFIGKIAGTTAANLYVWNSLAAALVYTNTTSGLAQVCISPNGQTLAYSAPTAVYVGQLSNPGSNSTVATGTANTLPQGSLSFSPDGSLLAYLFSTNPMPGSASLNVYLYDVLAQTNCLISQTTNGVPGNGRSDSPAFSPDGRFVAYRSYASNLAAGDSNGVPDIFIYDRNTGLTTLLTTGLYGTGSAGNRSLSPFFSSDGQNLVFQSAASDLVTSDYNGVSDVFVFNLFAGGMIQGFYLQIIPAAAPGQNPTLVWPVLSGTTYQFLFKNDLTDPAWQVLPGSPTIVGGTGYFTDPTPAISQRFYQIVGQ
jgi:Tol biopolymer transport system component